MAFVFERAEQRPEVRQNVAGTISFWPKLDGEGNVTASSTPGANTVSVYNAGGSLLSGPTNVSPTADGDGSRFDLSILAIDALQENAYVVLSWTQSGGSVVHVDTIYFDVVLQPWGPSTVSLNDLLSRVPSVAARLERQRARLDPTGALSLTAEQIASQYGALAHDELYRRLAGRIALDVVASLGVKTRPRLITNRRLLHPIEAALALAFLHRADLTEGASFDGRFTQEARALYDEWSKIADVGFNAIGELKYDLGEDRTVDASVVPPSRAVRTRRVQGA